MDGRFPLPLSTASRNARRHWTTRYFEGPFDSIETRSGDASRLSCTQKIRDELNVWMKEQHIKNLVDAGCGDLNWVTAVSSMSALQWYAGYDIVPELIVANQETFEQGPNRVFSVADISTCQFLPSEALLCRRVLNYFSIADVLKTLKNLSRHEGKFMLLTTHPGADNQESIDHQFRPLDLCAPPFNLPVPKHLISDYIDFQCTPAQSNLAVWETSDVLAAIEAASPAT